MLNNPYRNSCTNGSDSLAKAIERVCREKDIGKYIEKKAEKKTKGEKDKENKKRKNENGNRKENFDNEYYESFEWFWDKKKEKYTK